MTTFVDAPPRGATLQMIRAEINMREFHRWMGGNLLQDPDHAMHCLLKECFGELAPKPFRLIAPREGARGFLYGYGTAAASALRAAAAIYADPLQCRIMPLHKLDSKPMPSQWQMGKRLGFETRIRPVVRLQKDLSRVPADKLRLFRVNRRHGDDPEKQPRPGKECDVFQWEALLQPKRGMNRSREEVYTEWLGSKLKRCGGASLEPGETRLVSFQRTRAIRKRHARYSEGPDAVMRGILRITDPDAFAALLVRGVGRHRAYGYGMLLLRPPHK